MADIQPKNTDTIRVNVIKEKTSSSGITLDNIIKTDSIIEKTGSAGVSLNALLKVLTTGITPLISTMDIGTSTSAEHIRELFVKDLTSTGQNLTVGTESVHDVDIKTNSLIIASLKAGGDISQNATNGGNLLWGNKQGTAVTTGAATTGLTATGTTISDALALTAVFNNLTTVTSNTGAKLWDAPVNARVEVRNAGANALLVYPHSGTGTLNGGSAGASVSVASGSMAVFVRVSSTNWIAWEVTSPAA